MTSRYQELKAEKERIEIEMAEALAEEAAPALAETKERIAAYGWQPADLFDAQTIAQLRSRSRPSRSTVPPKYRNPDDHTETWGGKGGQPKWYMAALARGVKPQEMLIPEPELAAAAAAHQPPRRGRPPNAHANAEISRRHGAAALR